MTRREKKIFKKIYDQLLEAQKPKKNEIYLTGICSLFNFLGRRSLRSVFEIPEFAAFAPKEKRDVIGWHDKKYLYPSIGSFWWEMPMDDRKLAIEERLTAVAFMLTMPEDIVPELTKQKKSKKKKK